MTSQCQRLFGDNIFFLIRTYLVVMTHTVIYYELGHSEVSQLLSSSFNDIGNFSWWFTEAIHSIIRDKLEITFKD